MQIKLHSRAATTPDVRRRMQTSQESPFRLSRRHGVTWETANKWKSRAKGLGEEGEVQDRSHTPHRLQTTLTESQGLLVVELRKMLQLTLDDLLKVTQTFISTKASRSALDRLLRRHGENHLRKPVEPAADEKPRYKPFKAYEPGYLHIDVKFLPKMADQKSREYLFVAIDRATRWVHIEIYENKTAANAEHFLRQVAQKCPLKICKILTDNGLEFTDRLFGGRSRPPTGDHEFDQLCTTLGIEHRLTQPRTPQTNGMVERFNGRISEVLRTNHFKDGEDLRSTLRRYVWLYNHQIPQKALDHNPPIAALKKWYTEKPDLFQKKPRNQAGLDKQGAQDLPPA